MTTPRIRSRQSVQRFARRVKREYIVGVLGNNAGTVDHPTRASWVYVRLHGDGNQVVLAFCPSQNGVVHTAGLPVTLERSERNNAPYYEVMGLASGSLYPGSEYDTIVGPHAAQHERRSFGQGGSDPLDVYPRMLTTLRGMAQATPDLTAYVAPGLYQNSTGAHYWPGGSSPAVTMPVGVSARRCDLLYIDSADTLQWVTGTPTVLVTPARPDAPADAVVVAYVYLDSTLTTITDACFEDVGHTGIATLSTTFETTPVSRIASADAGWCWFADPRAVHLNGQTYLGYIRKDGDIVVRSYNHLTGALGTEVELHAALEVDDHDNPTLLVRDSDKRVLVFYAKHSNNVLYLRISTNPEDVSAFGVETNLQASLGGTEISYPSPIQLLGEASDPIWLFWRNPFDLTTQAWWYSKSTDGGATWAARTEMLREANRSAYIKTAQNGDDRIDFAFSDGHPANDADVSICHYYYTGNKWYQTDGTEIGSLPINKAAATLVYDGATTTSWVWDIAIDHHGYPVIAFVRFPLVTDHRYMYARWTGTAWVTSEICAAGGTIYAAAGAEDYYSGGIYLDHDDPSVVYLSKFVAGQFEIYRYWTPDGGTTWESSAITRDSASKQIRPITVRNAADGLDVLWLSGTYTTYVNFDLDALMVWHEPETGQVKVTENDDRAGFLAGKIAAGTNITLTEQNDGDEETLLITSADQPGSAWGVLVTEIIAWDDLRIAGAMVRAGSTAPALGAFGPSGSLKVLRFENGHHDEVHFEVQMPHNWKVGTKVYPHVHWTPVSATAGNVVWELEYAWQDINGTFGAPSNMTADATAAGGTAWVHKMTYLKDGSGNTYIDGTGIGISSMLVCRLHRNAGAGSDTLAADVALLEFDLHYQVDGLGSDAEGTKAADTLYAPVYADGDIVMTETLR